jgi:hypothetical protein
MWWGGDLWGSVRDAAVGIWNDWREGGLTALAEDYWQGYNSMPTWAQYIDTGVILGGMTFLDLYSMGAFTPAQGEYASELLSEEGSISLGRGGRGAGCAVSRWGSNETLSQHFIKHGADFGARSADEYARMADDFFVRAQTERLPTKIDADGVIRIYDPESNTFAAYNADGTTKTFFKPTGGIDYWNRQSGSIPWTP